jgi:hypothetical protein
LKEINNDKITLVDENTDEEFLINQSYLNFDKRFLQEDIKILLKVANGKEPLNCSIPIIVQVEVQNTMGKEALTSSGIKIKDIPSHVRNGDKILVRTDNNHYSSKVID